MSESAPIPALLLGLGAVLKRIPWVPDYLIPLILLVMGGLIHGAMFKWDMNQIIVGCSLGLSAVGLNQLFRQTREMVNNDNNPPPPTPPLPYPAV
jgi:ABC-type uncharacterized transport system permease subunit